MDRLFGGDMRHCLQEGLTGLSPIKIWHCDLKPRMLVVVFCDLKHAPDLNMEHLAGKLILPNNENTVNCVLTYSTCSLIMVGAKKFVS